MRRDFFELYMKINQPFRKTFGTLEESMNTPALFDLIKKETSITQQQGEGGKDRSIGMIA